MKQAGQKHQLQKRVIYTTININNKNMKYIKFSFHKPGFC